MLFNSDVFLFEFLPAVLVGFFLIRRIAGARAAQILLAVSSVAFYAWSGWDLLVPLFASILVNFAVGRALSRSIPYRRATHLLLALGICFDLGLLGYFKYADFVAANLQAIGFHLAAPSVVLPLGISFYTFTQIAFLVDAARREAKEYDLPRYILFVTFFPHLIAGPIIHHKEMMPQFAPEKLAERKFELLPEALMLFAIGLAKKVLLADGFAELARPVFAAAAAHAPPDLIAAWGATLCYTFQIYFDFSGYSDMALGLALMFGIRLPINFLSPYKSTSIIEFWRHWHMTLSRFLRDYLYFPLGGNRKGTFRRYANLMAVMTIGGLWHGAGWTFVFWGALHGLYLLVNHAWRTLAHRGLVATPPIPAGRALTFVCVALAWVLFRSDNLEVARSMYAGLFGLNGIAIAANLLHPFGIEHGVAILGVPISLLYSGQTAQLYEIVVSIFGMIVVLTLPNSMELCGFAPAPATGLTRTLQFQMLPRYAVATAIILFLCVCVINSGAVSEFIYYRF
ncbi:MAG TPA: MBOAT family protein [Stellaceae bacterium]|jgi:D-alanyl-lipoteichoic acid acyltransferase DltB (MBOAT superfamily)|nr:MBOAT family protein [Stellaceae bacterium]